MLIAKKEFICGGIRYLVGSEVPAEAAKAAGKGYTKKGVAKKKAVKKASNKQVKKASNKKV